MLDNREFDVVIWGATGFTGSLVCEYMLERYGLDDSLRWAIAGRNEKKLDDLKVALGQDATDLTKIVADSNDEASLSAMVLRTRVIISTVGPYARFGSALVAACADQGTHYCDLSGEVQWVRKMIDLHHDRARETGARIVHCCGFDSVPMDIGAWFLQEESRRRHDQYCQSITMLVRATKGGASGGTFASLINVIKEAKQDRSIARQIRNPYCLNPNPDYRGLDERDQRDVRYDETAKVWTAPFVMAGVNTRVVRRSHALNGFPYGDKFRYHEAVVSGKGIGGRLKGTVITLTVGALVFAASFDGTRKMLERFILPKPGEGPTREERESGFFNLMLLGTLPDGKIIRAKVTGDRDPGYGSTSKMLSECAVCLAKDGLDIEGGIWTPASAMAAPLFDRLQANAGLAFRILDD